jgi:hypothetical protein
VSISYHLAAVFFFIASGCSAYLWSHRLPLPRDRSIRLLSGIVLWEIIQLVPVHLLASLQMAGLITRVTIPSLAAFQGLILAGSLAYMVWRRPRLSPEHPGDSAPKLPRFLLVSIAILTCSYLVFALDVFTSFPNGSDAIAYHLPLAVHWLQTGSLAIPPTRAWRFSLPGNAEIGMMVMLAAGTESSVVLINWLALAALVIATYLLGRRMSRGNHIVSVTVVLLMLTIPIIEFQTLSAYVDLYGTAFLTAAFALFLNRKGCADSSSAKAGSQQSSTALLSLSAAACGITMGTKPTFYLYSAGYFAFVLFSLWKEHRGEQKTVFVRAVLMIVCGLLIPSAFWFGRSLEQTRNPIFPMKVTVGKHVLLPGYSPSEITDPNFDQSFVRSRLEWLIYPWTEWKRNRGYLLIPYGEGSGLGAVFASFVPIGIAFLFYRCCAQPSRSGGEILLLAALAVLGLAWWFVLHRVPRFGLPIVVLACIAAIPFIGMLQSSSQKLFPALFIGAIVTTCAISTFVPVHLLLGRIRTHRWARAQFYSYPPVLDRLRPGGCVLNATGREEENFALAGNTLSNCVVPAFEVPHQLTPDFLREHNVSFVVETVQSTGEASRPLDPATSMSLLETDMILSGETEVLWRVWKVAKP